MHSICKTTIGPQLYIWHVLIHTNLCPVRLHLCVYLPNLFESGLHAARLITVHEQNTFKYVTKISSEKYCFDKPSLLYHPHISAPTLSLFNKFGNILGYLQM